MLITVKRPTGLISLFALLLVTTWKLAGSRISSAAERFSFNITPASGISKSHNEIFSVSTSNGKFFMIDFWDQPATNPNIIPHPNKTDQYIVVAQLHYTSLFFAELVCNAAFTSDKKTLRCLSHPTNLPVSVTYGSGCTGDYEFLSLGKGPHDARVFYGPDTPYTTFGSNSHYTCFGQWIQDFRTLSNEWFPKKPKTLNDWYLIETELKRPEPWSILEKNWFMFWDEHNQSYVHYDVSPKRVFAKVDWHGNVDGEDLAPFSAESDRQCMNRFMPDVAEHLESVHQSTNSLSITMCKRGECTPDSSNTYIFHIFQHKSYLNFHSIYEPYVMLFAQAAPFQVTAISKKPFWVHGRKGTGRGGELQIDIPPSETEGLPEEKKVAKLRKLAPWTEQMFYITSMSWKAFGMTYHGYLDDELFVSFGIEDKQSGAIDIVAGDLLRDIEWC